MLDKDLFISEDQRPPIIVTPLAIAYALPNAVTPNYLDLRTQIDIARASAIFGYFRISTSFVGDAANWLRPVIMVDDVPNFVNTATHPELLIALGPQLTTPLLVSGMEVAVAMPPLNLLANLSIESAGKRYVTLGIQAVCATTDWTAGGITAFFAPQARGARGMSHPAGY